MTAKLPRTGNGLTFVVALGVVSLSVSVASGQTVQWNYDLQTSGQDVFYNSATAVDNTAPLYFSESEITLAEVTVSYLGIPFGPFDITGNIPPEFQNTHGWIAGPPPMVVFDGTVRYPDPPDPITFQAHFSAEVDAAGFGHVSATDVVLGEAEYDLGFPFGVVTVQIESVRLVGTVWMTPTVYGDLDGDGDVDLSDLSGLIANYGTIAGATYENGDLDGDGDVDLNDLAGLLANYGHGT